MKSIRLNIIILIGLAAVLVGMFLYLFVFRGGFGTQAPQEGVGTLPEFDFGDIVLPSGEQEITPGTGFGEEVTLDQQTGVRRARLFRITDNPITGYAVAVTSEERLETVTKQIDIVDEATGEVFTEFVSEDVINVVQVPRVRFNDWLTGFIYEVDFISGDFGPRQLTENAIPRTGEWFFVGFDTVIGRLVRTMFDSIQTYTAKIVSGGETVSCPFSLTGKLQEGATGRDVENVQSLLQFALGGGIAFLPGTFDGIMTTAVKEFQSNNKATADGIIGRATNALLEEVCIARERAAQERELAEDPDRTPFVLDGAFEPRDVLQIATAPDGYRFFKLFRDTNGNAFGVIEDTQSGQQTQVYNRPYGDWTVQWPTDDMLTLTSKPSGFVSGHLYTLSVDGALHKLINAQIGLTTRMSPDGGKVLYSRYVNDAFEFGVFNVATRQYTRLPAQTLPEKCVWSSDSITIYCGVPKFFPEGVYPDDWYQYTAQFNDSLWRINTTTRETDIIDDLVTDEPDMDIVKLQLDPQERNIFFVNQVTQTLWTRILE